MGFIRLIRINNLLIIVITLIGVWYGSAHSLILNSQFISYLLMILFTILIAGAGNAINDYFDVKADPAAPSTTLWSYDNENGIIYLGDWVLVFSS